MQGGDITFSKQLLIFSAILIVSLSLLFWVRYFKDDIASLAQKAAAGAAENGKAFGELMTEDLDPDF